MRPAIVPVLISFHTPRWIRAGLGSYLRHFPGDRVLVIDNNPRQGEPGWEPACEEERAWLAGRDDITFVRHHGPDPRHGAAIDTALRYCRKHGGDILLLFEPDCLITGTNWYELLRRPMLDGAWMSGMDRQMYGPLHPCPSMWRVDGDWASFADQPRGADVRHPRFDELFFLQRLLRSVESEHPHMLTWWQANWDTAQKNWFHAAAHDQAVQVPKASDFRHFWGGSTANRDNGELETNPSLRDYITRPPQTTSV